MNQTNPPQSHAFQQLQTAIDRLIHIQRPRFRRLWAYYSNPMAPLLTSQAGGSERPYRQAQEWGLPARITGVRNSERGEQVVGGVRRKEIVIENDIGWRIDTLVDYLFGRPVAIRSAAPDPARRAIIDQLIGAILSHNGGIAFLQQLALLGSVYGFVDVLVKLNCEHESGQKVDENRCPSRALGRPPMSEGARSQAAEPGSEAEPHPPEQASQEGGVMPVNSIDPGGPGPETAVARLARMIRLEVIEPSRALPLLSREDYRVVEAYAQVWETACACPGEASPRGGRWWRRLMKSASRLLGEQDGRMPHDPDKSTLHVELITPDAWYRYQDQQLISQGANSLGRIPLVHIQNSAVPFEYAGGGDVEPLIPLQDELNTRLSDRANRIALQSFKMYLGKGIENFIELPVAPGRMWSTDNDRAEVIEFGGDADCPAETAHIADLREAMDKASGVSPIAAGAIKNRIGRLTSAAALRVTLMSLLSRTEKRRTTYGAGIERMIELALAWLDAAGLFRTTEAERAVELNWSSPLPENEMEKLQEASIKARLGVPREVVLRELGY